MTIQRTIVAVPARLESSRLPNKVLADIGGKPMIQRVLERCRQAKGPVCVVLCTDSRYLQQLAEGWGFPVLLTSTDCSSGSERIASVVHTLVKMVWPEHPSSSQLTATAVINVQGDQPFIDPGVITAAAAECVHSDVAPAVLTPVYPLKPEHIHNPAVVKALLTSAGRALTFSRSAIPHVRDVAPANWHSHTTYWGHVGLYAYRADVLAQWSQMPASTLEQVECLEQLRLIEAGYTVNTFPVSGTSLSVDTPHQLEEARVMATLTDADSVFSQPKR